MSFPAIYFATYSNVDVYECMVGETALMRRVSDDWINATQILKAANFPKASRTRILEKEIQTGVHEKIQGGYGRFQGTWIPLQLARPLAHKYKITDEMAPILTYVPQASNRLERKPKAGGAAPTGTVKSTASKKAETKAKAKPKESKKRKESSASESKPQIMLQQQQQQQPVSDGSFWQQNDGSRLSQIPQQYQQQYQQQVISQSQYGAPPQMAPIYGQYSQVQNGYYQQQAYQQQQQQQSYTQQRTQQYQIPEHQSQSQQGTQMINQTQSQASTFTQGIPQQQQQYQQLSQQQHQQQQQQPFATYQQHQQKNSNENWSQDDANSIQMDEAMQTDTSISSEHSSMAQNDSKNGKTAYTEALVNFFSNGTDQIPMVLLHPPSDFDFNEPIDEEGHTPLHWASSMASPALIELLLKNGADPLTPNGAGLNCVSRAIFFNNSYQKGNFHLIVQLMKNCLYTPDKAGRTPLHYLCESTRSKTDIAQYYLQTVLDQLALGNENLIKIVVNHKDVQGDSALDLSRMSENTALYDCLTPYQQNRDQQQHQKQTQQTQQKTDTLSAIRTPASTRPDEDHLHDADTTLNDQTDSANGDEEQEDSSRLPKLPMTEVGSMLASMLSSLADAYDSELKNKEEESTHTKTVLVNLQQDLQATESQNREVLGQIANGMSLSALQLNISHLESDSAKKTESLARSIERGQALNMAKAVLKEESSIGSFEAQGGNQLALAIELTKLQVNRTRIIDNIISEVSSQNINTKMNNYRKLIGLACDLKPENVDELIDEIEADLLTTVSG